MGKEAPPVESDRFRALFDAMADAVVIVTKTGEIIEANEWATKVTGYSHDELVGMNVLTSPILTAESRALVVKNIVKRFAGMHIEPYEIEVIAKDGRLLPVELNARLIELDGRPADLVVFRDISERRKARQALRESEERFRTIFENVSDAVIYLDLYGTIIDVSPSITAHFGYTPHELVGKHFLKLGVLGARDIPRLAGIFKQIITKGKAIDRMDLEITDKHGNPASIEVSSRLVRKEGRIEGVVTILRNVTERRGAEEELHQRAAFVLNNPAPMLQVGHDGTVLLCNKAAELLTQSDLVGTKVHGPLPTLSKTTLGKLKAGDPFQFEEHLGMQDYLFTIIKHGQSKSFFIYGTDITQLKNAEAAVRESEEKLRTIIENTSDIIYNIDLDGIVTFVTHNVTSLGFKQEDVVGHPLTEFVHPDDVAHVLDDMKRSLTTGKEFPTQLRLMRKDGSFIHAEESGRIIKENGTPVGITGVIRDITERKQAEEQLRKLARAVEHSPASVVITAPNGTIEYVNPAFTKVTGYTAEEVVGGNPRILKSGSYPKRFYKELWTTITAGRTWHGEFHNRRKNGEPYWETASISPVLDEKGETTHFVAVKEDITERKRLEEELHTHRKHLEVLVEERTAALQSSLAEKELLLKEVHHRVKNNLQVISSLLNLQSGRLTDDEAREMFRISQGRVKSMALIHESLYRASDLASIDFDAYAQRLVNDLVRNYRVGTGAAQVKVDVADVHLGIDKAVPCGLIINELVTNALKHAFPKGREGTITVSMEKGKKDTLVLIVADDGVGIPKDFDLATSDSLGMQLVHTLTGQLDGKIDLDRKGGTTFRITFPKAMREKSTKKEG